MKKKNQLKKKKTLNVNKNLSKCILLNYEHCIIIIINV